MIPSQSRGFTLLISVILTAVVLAVALALLDIAYKSILLASSATQSDIAFYNADSAMECTLWYDQNNGGQIGAFDYSGTPPSTISCSGYSGNTSTAVANGTRTTTFTLNCPGGGTFASVTVYKKSTADTTIFVNGYNTCTTSDPRRIERGLKLYY